MPGPLVQNRDTFTPERVRRILDDGSLRLDTKTGLGAREERENTWMQRPVEFLVRTMRFEYRTDDPLIALHQSDGRRERATAFCRTYVALIHDPSGHLERLDNAFSELVACNFYPVDPPENVVQQACQVLTRLPGIPFEFRQRRSESYDQICGEYFCAGQDRTWETLKVVQYVNTITVRLALRISTNEGA